MGKLFDFVALGAVVVGGIYIYQNPKVLDEISAEIKKLFNKEGGTGGNSNPTPEPDPEQTPNEADCKDLCNNKKCDEYEAAKCSGGCSKCKDSKSKYSQIYDFPFISYRTIAVNNGKLDSNRISYF